MKWCAYWCASPRCCVLNCRAYAASGDYLTTMDLIRAKARFALDKHDRAMPIVEEGSSIPAEKRTTHPVGAKPCAKEGKEVSFRSIWYSPRKSTFSLSPGPNGGGKVGVPQKLWAFCNT
ncbi:MAG: hypothetical protein ACLR8Y_17305 [Alistipes indistinctus]